MDITILFGPILVGCWWIFQCCLDFDIDQRLGLFDQYDDYGDEDIEKKNYLVIIGHVK